MRRYAIVGLVLIAVLIAFVSFFYLTGGAGMWRVVKGYLIKDIPGKRYSWSDFRPNNESRKVSGFYSAALSNEHRLVIWTLAGLQIFSHKPGKSVYYHRDTCGVVRQLAEKKANNGDGSSEQSELTNPLAVYLDPVAWIRMMKQEYLLTVQWERGDGGRQVANVWSVSGRYREIGRVEEGVCD